MKTALRWISALPLAVIAALAIYLFLHSSFGVTYGFEELNEFWAARNMGRMPISGIYILIVTRGAMAASFICTLAWVIPADSRKVAKAAAILLIGSSLLILTVLSLKEIESGALVDLGIWARHITELVGLAFGTWFGIQLSNRLSRNEPI